MEWASQHQAWHRAPSTLGCKAGPHKAPGAHLALGHQRVPPALVHGQPAETHGLGKCVHTQTPMPHPRRTSNKYIKVAKEKMQTVCRLCE